MRILFCSALPLDSRLGTAKALIELAAHLEAIGWTCRLASDQEICPGYRRYAGLRPMLSFTVAMGRFVERHAREFDVVDYDQFLLSFPRSRFSPSTLLVARSALLHHHFTRIAIPRARGLRPLAGALVKGPMRAAYLRLMIRQSSRTMAQADLVNVNNTYDREELCRRGFDRRKIAVVPLGLSRERLASLAAGRSRPADPPTIAVVGSFELRKGSLDLPGILDRLGRAIPGCRLKLLGTGLGIEAVRGKFPPLLAERVDVVPSFAPEALPSLLRGCAAGVFPSYVEGFGFGVLEMLAASLPVFAYDAPGAPMMLSREYLVPRGHVGELAARLAALLERPEAYESARTWARHRATEFTWERAARMTSDVYSERLAALRGAALRRA